MTTDQPRRDPALADRTAPTRSPPGPTLEADDGIAQLKNRPQPSARSARPDTLAPGYRHTHRRNYHFGLDRP